MILWMQNHGLESDFFASTAPIWTGVHASWLVSGGGSGGNTINVYPSQGMNESELASIISRQIAFQLRRGGA